MPDSAEQSCPGTCSAFCQSQDRVACVSVAQSRAVRWWLVLVGVFCVVLGGVGVVVPGLPTTVFLIIASWCFLRSCPTLERVLIRNKFFGPFVRYLVPGAVMPKRARIIATAMLWTAVGASSALLLSRGIGPIWIGIILLAALIGTAAVWLFARPKQRVIESPSISAVSA